MPVSARLNHPLSPTTPHIPGREIPGSEKSSGHSLGSILKEGNLIVSLAVCLVL